MVQWLACVTSIWKVPGSIPEINLFYYYFFFSWTDTESVSLAISVRNRSRPNRSTATTWKVCTRKRDRSRVSGARKRSRAKWHCASTRAPTPTSGRTSVPSAPKLSARANTSPAISYCTLEKSPTSASIVVSSYFSYLHWCLLFLFF